MNSASLTKCQLCLFVAPCFAITTWGVLLHRYTMRGDFVLLGHAIGLVALYLVLDASETLSNIALRTSVEAGVAYMFTLALVTVGYRVSPLHPLASYPGPFIARITSLWLSYISSTGKRYLILDALHARYGPFLRIGPDTISINSSRAVPLYTNAEKSEMYRAPGHHTGVTSLFFKFKPDDPERHRARRHIWSGMFAPDALASLHLPLEQRTVQLLKTLERRQVESGIGFVDLYETIYHWAYDFMGDMVFGGCSKIELMKEGDPRNLIQIGRRSLAMLDFLGQSPWLIDVLWYLPFTGRWRIHHKNTAEMMGNRIKAGDLPGYRDLASHLIEGGVSGDDLQAESIVAVVGGSDSTSVMVTFAIYFLLSNPEYYRRLRKELDEAFPYPDSSLSPNILAGLVFLNGVVNETLRLAPSPYFYPRIVPPGGSVVDGRHVPEGTIFAIASYSQHISPENFSPSTLEFLPDRWQPNGLGPETRTNRTMLTSFAYGRHACNGRGFAYHQMRLGLARLLLALDFKLPDEFDPIEFRAGIVNIRTTFLEKPLYVKVTRRPGIDLDALENAVA